MEGGIAALLTERAVASHLYDASDLRDRIRKQLELTPPEGLQLGRKNASSGTGRVR
ncbi:MAG: hypothetical protein IPP22_02980 [Nitrosomonas sp.]|nr:hypothetical protein [Nitrosomonas sp.]